MHPTLPLLIFQGAVSTEATLPATGNTYGDLWLAKDTGNNWVWYPPGEWENVGPNPKVGASIRDLCESLDYLITEDGYGDKIYLHNTFTTHTYNNESLILVDTTVPRIIRLGITVNIKKSVVIKDISGLAGINPVLITLIGEGVTLQGSPDREYTLYVNWGSVTLTASLGDWTVTVPRSTCISMRGFRLPQNLNLVLPPAVGAVRQSFGALAYFPATMPGKDIVPATFNGFTAAVHTLSQITLGDPVTSSLTSLFGYPDPPTTSGKEFSDLSIVNDLTLNVPTDAADLSTAFLFLSNKTIMPGVKVYINLPYQSAITSYLNFNHPQASQITIQGITPYTFSPAASSIFSVSPGAVLMDVQVSPEDRGSFNVGDIVLIDSTTPTFRRWNGAWSVISTTATSFRILITDWGSAYPTNALQPQQSRWRQMKSLVTVTANNALALYGKGATIKNLAFIGQLPAPGLNQANCPLVALDLVNLRVVSATNFATGLYAAIGGVINGQDLFCSSNQNGLTIDRGGSLNANFLPSSTGVYVTGNSNCGFEAVNAQARINPLYAVGNKTYGIYLDRAAAMDIINSFIQKNQYGVVATTDSVSTGNTNTITTNVTNDVFVSDGALVKMSSTSAVLLNYPNKVLNADGSRIELL
jgi:hypothetical protein